MKVKFIFHSQPFGGRDVTCSLIPLRTFASPNNRELKVEFSRSQRAAYSIEKSISTSLINEVYFSVGYSGIFDQAWAIVCGRSKGYCVNSDSWVVIAQYTWNRLIDKSNMEGRGYLCIICLRQNNLTQNVSWEKPPQMIMKTSDTCLLVSLAIK